MEVSKRTTDDRLNKFLLILVFILGVSLTVPILSRIPSHPDEHQFYFNAFKIMAGEELHNYLHVALTEYALATFLSVVNLFTDSGVNFPQGDPSLATLYYGKIFGFVLYILGFIFGALIVQRGESKIRLRTVVFGVLYFSSISLFERFLRVSSDSMMILVFLNFVILSFWMHKNKASVLKFFLLNLAFIFLGTFTNLKSLYMFLPLAVINFVSPFVWYENARDRESKLPLVYRLVLYGTGMVVGGVVLWSVFIPKPFDYIRFWYGIKKTIVHGTKFDFDYPSQSFNSWAVYLYDFVVQQIGLPTLLAFGLILFASYRIGKSRIFREVLEEAKNQINLRLLKEGNLYEMTEFILFLSFISYYIGVSTRVVHWSRWGAPLGMLGIMILGTVAEKFITFIHDNREKMRIPLPVFFAVLILLTIMLRVFVFIDLYKTAYPKMDGFTQTTEDIDRFLASKGITQKEEKIKKSAWFTGYTHNVNSLSLELLLDDVNKEVEYIFWPYWNIGLLHTKKNVDLETHNQRAFVDKYAESITYRFPTILSYYMHYTKYFAWRVLGITWNPETDSLVETQYGVVKLKEPVRSIEYIYSVSFKDMSHYYFPYSQIFNLKTLPDGYMFPPCYSYPDTRYVKDNERVLPPEEIGMGARTAGLYCHSTRIRVLFRGMYRIRVEGLPENVGGVQKVFSNISTFDWDPETKTISVEAPTTMIPGDFGVATKEKHLPNLKFTVFYKAE